MDENADGETRGDFEQTIALLKEAASDRLSKPDAYLAEAIKEMGGPVSSGTLAQILDTHRRTRGPAASTRWALMNAVTAHARVAPTSEDARGLEELGGLMSRFGRLF